MATGLRSKFTVVPPFPTGTITKAAAKKFFLDLAECVENGKDLVAFAKIVATHMPQYMSAIGSETGAEGETEELVVTAVGAASKTAASPAAETKEQDEAHRMDGPVTVTEFLKEMFGPSGAALTVDLTGNSVSDSADKRGILKSISPSPCFNETSGTWNIHNVGIVLCNLYDFARRNGGDLPPMDQCLSATDLTQLSLFRRSIAARSILSASDVLEALEALKGKMGYTITQAFALTPRFAVKEVERTSMAKAYTRTVILRAAQHLFLVRDTEWDGNVSRFLHQFADLFPQPIAADIKSELNSVTCSTRSLRCSVAGFIKLCQEVVCEHYSRCEAIAAIWSGPKPEAPAFRSAERRPLPRPVREVPVDKPAVTVTGTAAVPPQVRKPYSESKPVTAAADGAAKKCVNCRTSDHPGKQCPKPCRFQSTERGCRDGTACAFKHAKA